MKKIKNLIYLFVFTGILFALKFLVIDKIFVDFRNDAQIWFTSGLVLVVLGIFITEKYFTKPIDVIMNVIVLFVVLSMLENVGQFLLYWPLFVFSLLIGLVASISFILIDEEKDRNFLSQKIAYSANIISSFLGSSRMLFSIVFILSIFSYFISSLENNFLINKEQIAVLSLIGFWGMLILIEPIDKKLITPLFEKIKSKSQPRLVGRIAKRLNPDVIHVEQLPGSPTLKSGDIVIIDDIKNSHSEKYFAYAMYISVLEAENKKYLHFYCLNSVATDINKQIYVYKNDSKIPEKISNLETYKNRSNVIGFVHSNSDIDVIKIRMIEGIDENKELKEGDLVAVNFYKTSTKYQIINVETESESIDGQSKQGGKIITAQQIGYWENDKQKFTDTGWVPSINAPVFIETPTEEIKINDNDVYKVGVVPRSKYPIFIDFKESVNHHTAIIGKTGTGKSYMAAKIIEKMVSSGYKVIVLEIDQSNSQSLSKYINQDLISKNQYTWTCENKNKTVNGKNVNYDDWKCTIEYNENKVFVVNWENKSKTQDDGPLNQTEGAIAVINNIIQYQLKNSNEKICVVMEEAYDFIPEINFGQQDYGAPKVSRISQVFLKCRKHNIGFLIITQRTALVTKTILYNCHTIIALQTFDETSKHFMGAYISQKYLDSMSILPRFRAIVVGKGSSCDKPVIVDFHDKKLADVIDKEKE